VLRIAPISLVAFLVWVFPAAATVDVDAGIRGAGTIEDATSAVVLPCEPASFDEATTVMCTPFQVPDAGSVGLRAVPAAEPAGHWELAGWEGCGHLTPMEVCQIDDGASGTSISPIAVFNDDTGPTIDEEVIETRSGEDERTVSFEFTADETAVHGATFACKLDDDPAEDCSSGTIEYPDLAVGDYSFSAQGTDASGNDGAEVTYEFAIEAPPIDPPPTGPPTTKPPPTKPPVVFPTLLFPRVLGPSAVTAKVARTRTFLLRGTRVKCPAVTKPCPAKAVLKGKLRKGKASVVLARQSFSVRPRTSSPVKLRLTRRAFKTLVAKRRLKAVASLTVRAPNVTTRKDVAITLRAPKKHQGGQEHHRGR
jgi:hypothetical protein